jgi:hypothetical protein
VLLDLIVSAIYWENKRAIRTDLQRTVARYWDRTVLSATSSVTVMSENNICSGAAAHGCSATCLFAVADRASVRKGGAQLTTPHQRPTMPPKAERSGGMGRNSSSMLISVEDAAAYSPMTHLPRLGVVTIPASPRHVYTS